MKTVVRIALFLCLSISVVAQNTGTGIYPFGAYDGNGLDTVNIGNLNVHFELPVVSRPGRGLAFNYALRYDGLIWSPLGNAWQPDHQWGFHGNVGDGFIGFLTYSTSTASCDLYGGGTYPGTYYTNIAYHQAEGIVHPFNYELKQCGGGAASVVDGDGKAIDGSGYSLDNTFVVHTPTGSIIDAPMSAGGSGSITDSNGNTISANGDGTFTDTLGVTALAVTGSGNAGSPRYFTYPVTRQSGGATSASVKVTYRSYTVQTNFQCGGISEYGPATVDLVDTIEYPDSPSDKYSFQYENTPGIGGSVTGRLKSITLPTGGTIDYSYSGGCNGTGISSDGAPVVLTRTTVSGSKTFTRAITGAGTSNTDVVDEANKLRSFEFSANVENNLPYETRRRIWDGSTNTTTPLMEMNTSFFFNYAGPAHTPLLRRVTTTSYNGGSQVSVRYNYIGLGGLVGSWFSFDPPTPSITLESWGASHDMYGNVINASYSSGSNILSQVINGYNESSVVPTSGLPQRGTSQIERGNLTSTSVWAGGSTWISTTYTNYDTGARKSATFNNLETDYSYDATQAFVTGLSTQTSGNSAVSSLSTSSTYDASSAAQLTSTGYNSGQTTEIVQYDPLMRPKDVTTPGGGEVLYTYTPGKITVQTKLNSSEWSTQETFFDNYGRRVRNAVSSTSSNWYLTDSCYDATGHLQSTSAAYSSSSDTGSSQCTSNSTSYTYDGLGRVLTISRPDGSSVTNTYWSRAVKTQSNPGKGTITQYDLIGRIKEVCELTGTTFTNSGAPSACPTDIAGTGYNSHYDYDDVNHKTTITQGSQARVFQTDAAGRTIHTEEPERGNTDYSYSYNSIGLVVTRTRPRANQTDPNVKTTATMQYDALGRLNSLIYDDGKTPTKIYSYDQATGWGGTNLGSSKGTLTNAHASIGAIWMESEFLYDSASRISIIGQCLPDWCGNPAHDVWRAYSYDLASRLTQESYTTSVGYFPVRYGYNLAGQLTSINGGQNDSTNADLIYSAATVSPFGVSASDFGNGLKGVNHFESSGRISGTYVCAGSYSVDCAGGE